MNISFKIEIPQKMRFFDTIESLNQSVSHLMIITVILKEEKRNEKNTYLMKTEWMSTC